MNDKLQTQIFAALDGTIDPPDFEQLQRTLEQNAEARQLYLECIELFESLGEAEPVDTDFAKASLPPAVSRNTSFGQYPVWFSAAAALLLICSLVAFGIGRRSMTGVRAMSGVLAADDGSVTSEPKGGETMVSGHASLRRTLDVRWATGTTPFQSGDLIPEGQLKVDEGIIELDFFCGASLVVEGPAELDIQSDWELTCHLGRLRATVPPAARGFVINAAETKIVDLGTEFALDVTSENARVEVIDGEVEIQHPSIDPERLITGQDKWLLGRQSTARTVSEVATPEELQQRQADQQRRSLRRWLAASNALRNDKRLIAYFPIESAADADPTDARRVSNAARAGPAGDGYLIGSVLRSPGRFGQSSTGLEFDRPGARVRVRLDGDFSAFSFVAWVKIDSLQHAYNALFMADGYENGEPHWQIDSEGRMMFSVMVDDRAEVTHYSPVEDAIVRGAGRHRVYRTPPIWDLSKSGRWMQLAAVYDPLSMRVRQYVDGEKVSDVPIEPDWLVKQLHIGAAELGNWGQPFRKTPSFAVRTLDGTIDEVAIFDAALSDQEILDLYQAGKP